MNPVSTKTWPHMGPIWASIWAHMCNPYGPIRLLSTCFIWVPCGFPIWVPALAQIFLRYVYISEYGPVRFGVRLFQKGPSWIAKWGPRSKVKSIIAQSLVSRTETWQRIVINKTKMSFLVTMKINY